MGEHYTNFRVMTTCAYTEITFESDAGHRTVNVQTCLSGVRVSMNVKMMVNSMLSVLLIKLSSEHASRVGRLR